MVRSMTAYARARQTTPEGELVWELRAVNHRFLEPHLRLPEELRGLEPPVRERLAARLARGKLDVTLRLIPAPDRSGALALNTRLLEQLLTVADQVGRRIGEPAVPHVFELLRWPGMLSEPEPDLDSLGAAALTLLEQAIDDLISGREREGARLRALMLERCEGLAALAAEVRAQMPAVLAGIRGRIADRLAEVRAELDPNRLEQEMALLAQRLDVDEELDRLGSHLEEVRRALDSRDPAGRRLDFLLQELNREANTLGSKSADAAVTRAAVGMKVLIEQLREQVQNLE